MGFATSLGFKPTDHSMMTFVLVKMLLDRYTIVIKTQNLCYGLVDLILGFATSLGFKPTDHRRPSYDWFSEHLSRGQHSDFGTFKDTARKASNSHKKTCSSYHRLVGIIACFTTIPRLKKTNNHSPSYGYFSEGVSLGEQRLPHAKSKAKLGSPLFFPLILE